MMRKIVLALSLVLFGFSTRALAVCLEFYYDEDGQTHAVECKNARQFFGVKCHDKGDFYWDGKACREVEVIKNCKKQGGGWYQVQLLPKSVFVNTCVCKGKLLWDGARCVSHLPQNMKKDVVNVWCDSLRKKVDAYIPNAKQLMK